MSIHTAFLFLLVAIYISSTLAQNTGDDGRVTYIIHIQPDPTIDPPSTREDREQWYKSFLPATSNGQPQLIYSYNTVISGFAARLTKEELEAIKNKSGFIHVMPDRLFHLTTTHSPSFLGLHKSSPGFWESSNYGKGVIIGVLDTGVTPDHPSFSDQGMCSPPTKWKGVCEFRPSNCNNKLIGARTLLKGINATRTIEFFSAREPYDKNGHGTHTASTAAGMFVKNANINGLANGTAAGIAPHAHLAIYKVCADDFCASSDILAGFDQAVDDGVDILSVSIAAESSNFYEDSAAIGAFGAMEKGVFVSLAGGNDGPFDSTVSNEAPWVMTVGASTMDRDLRSTVKLGDHHVFKGQTAYQPKSFKSSSLSLVYPVSTLSIMLQPAAPVRLFHGIDVKGMVVLCDEGDNTEVEKGKNVKNAGGAAMIIANVPIEGYTTFADTHVLPVAHWPTSLPEARA
ncbi:subtilisin-like protease [Dioscorea cayenensis subsp. rotundata]|uniref:Subtilisin-like protease n=1 Tax=Dioscorea cayennensis subsp. rotundata TaxID=55577 RepID=A0AB40B2J4_DIOCR|nr:subtilisin-like protease [Dioscorea cayenensis subsp. rotundata]